MVAVTTDEVVAEVTRIVGLWASRAPGKPTVAQLDQLYRVLNNYTGGIRAVVATVSGVDAQLDDFYKNRPPVQRTEEE